MALNRHGEFVKFEFFSCGWGVVMIYFLIASYVRILTGVEVSL
jgi:hypothetical protein